MGDRLYLFDTTLRDGEQAAGVNLNKREKLEIARLLEHLGVDVIEAGFAASSPGDFAAVELIAKEIRNASVTTLCRCVQADIDAGAKALRKAVDPLLHVFIATSPIHREYKLRMSAEQVFARAVESVKYARNLCGQVEFSCEDGSRTEPEFLYRILEAVIEAGATVVNIPDTVGYCMPDEFAGIIRGVFENVPNIDKARVSVHTHDDLGLAVASSLAAVCAGARQVEGTINGMGERAGNAALEEIIMAVDTRGELLGVKTQATTSFLHRTASAVSALSGIEIPPNKAIVGRNAFRHESGIHQHGVIANPLTYEIMTPASIGIVTSAVVLGKHSGRHGFSEKAKELGYTYLTEQDIDEAFTRFKELADAKKEITDRDIEALLSQKLLAVPESYHLDQFVTQSGNRLISTASVLLRHDGNEIRKAASGDGPVDAILSAITKAVGQEIKLESYAIKAVTEGTDALGEVAVRISINGVMATGRGLSADIIEASARAYISAINRALYEASLNAEAPEENIDE